MRDVRRRSRRSAEAVQRGAGLGRGCRSVVRRTSGRVARRVDVASDAVIVIAAALGLLLGEPPMHCGGGALASTTSARTSAAASDGGAAPAGQGAAFGASQTRCPSGTAAPALQSAAPRSRTDAHTVRGVRRPCRTRRVGRGRTTLPYCAWTTFECTSAKRRGAANDVWIQSCAAAWFCPPEPAQRHLSRAWRPTVGAASEAALRAGIPRNSYLGDAANTLLLPS